MTNYDEVAQSMHELIGRDRMWRSVVEDHRNQGTDWYSSLLGRLTMAVGDAEVLFLSSTGEYSQDEQSFTGKVIIYLDGAFVVVSVERTFNGQDAATTEVAVFGRRPLQRFEVLASTAAWPRGNWPGRLRVRLVYGNGATFDLPLSTVPDRAEHAELEALLPGLRSDLAKS